MPKVQPTLSDVDRCKAEILDCRIRIDALYDAGASDAAIEEAILLRDIAIENLDALYTEQAEEWRGVDALT